MKTKISATAIHTRTYLDPSDPRSQACNGAVSTAVGDHAGILRAVVFFCFLLQKLFSSSYPICIFIIFN